MAATLYRADGTFQPIIPDNGVNFSSEELYEHLQCEEIHVLNVGMICGDDSMLIYDGDKQGRSNQMINDKATIIAHANHVIPRYDYIVGDVILCDSDMLEL